jgi:hypothetical protein
MKNLMCVLAVVGLGCACCFAEPAAPTFKKIQLSDKFFCEGAYHGGFNKDGKIDVVAGPFWFEGPDFQKKHEIRPATSYDPKEYSDNFLTFAGDFNGDAWPDVFYVSYPGKEGDWYENPAGKGAEWKKHLGFKVVDNESPMWGDINGDGRPELVFNTGGQLGFATYDPGKPDEPWTFHAITPKAHYQMYTHGIGFGDVNGDGRMDMLEAEGWWEQQSDAKDGQPWVKHPFKFADAAAQMHVYDVDGDGLADVITAWHCHAYGLVWWKQVKKATGEITFEKNLIMGQQPAENAQGWKISQLHAIELVDMNGDGLKDILTGKRFWAHGPQGDAEPGAPAMLVWFELVRDKDKGVKFVGHAIDDNSGVGTQVDAADLNGDGTPDVIVGNKKGIFVFLSQSGK